MSKALVIKGVDFSENKLTTVTLLDSKSCVSIELDKTTLSLANLGTESTLVATVLPADTTDLISWSTSNARIATVSNGVVTVNGAGEATITATCGTKTAECKIIATVEIVPEIMLKRQITRRGTVVNAKNAVIQIGNEQDNDYYGCGFTTSKPKETYKHIYEISTITGTLYPIYFGCASKIEIEAPTNIKVTAVITDSQHTTTENDIDNGAAMWVKSDASAYDDNVPYGSRTITEIPEAADSVGFSFRKTTNDLTLSDLSNISIIAY